MILQRYTFGSKSQQSANQYTTFYVVYDIAKIYIWKQITTAEIVLVVHFELFMILQRYTFGSKSQQSANQYTTFYVVYDIAKIYIWKQITTAEIVLVVHFELFMILQRYTFGSKSQPLNFLNTFIVVAYDIAKIGNFSQIATP